MIPKFTIITIGDLLAPVAAVVGGMLLYEMYVNTPGELSYVMLYSTISIAAILLLVSTLFFIREGKTPFEKLQEMITS